MLLGCHPQLVVEGVVPDALHVVPVGDDAVLDGVLETQHASLALGLVPNVRVLLAHADHHALLEQGGRGEWVEEGGGGGGGGRGRGWGWGQSF